MASAIKQESPESPSHYPTDDGGADEEGGTALFTPENPPPESQLFKPSRTRNKGNFLCIRLIGPESQSDGRQWTSDEAIGAWCTACNCSVMWRKGESNGLSRHMRKCHQDILKEAGIDRPPSSKKRKRQGIESRSPKREVKVRKTVLSPKVVADETKQRLSNFLKKPLSCSLANQSRFDALTTLWVHKNLRPYSVIDDKGLRDLLSFASTIKGEPQFVSSEALRLSASALDSICCQKILANIQKDADYYTISLDIWPNERRQSLSLAATTIYYVTPSFEIKKFTLRTSASTSNWDENSGSRMLSQTLENWGLSSSKLACVLHGNHSTMSTFGGNITAPAVVCIGKSLHMVVAPCCCSINKDQTTNDIADFEMDERARTVMEKPHVKEVRNVVFKVREIAMFMRHSGMTKADLLQYDTTMEVDVSQLPEVVTDVPERWASTERMIEGLVKNQDLIHGYLVQLKDHAEFSNQSIPKLPSERDWALLTGAWILLTPFKTLVESVATEQVLEAHGDKVPTMVYAFPFLRRVKEILGLPDLFRDSDMGKSSREKAGKSLKDALENLLSLHGDEEYWSQVATTLEGCQKTMKEEFDVRFESLDKVFLWTSMLDPRLRKLNHCTELERTQAKLLMIDEMLQLEASDTQTQIKTEFTGSHPASSTMVNDMFGDVFDDPSEHRYDGNEKEFSASSSQPYGGGNDRISPSAQSAQYELSQYLLAPSVGKNISALQWWHAYGARFPMLSRVARKWLSVVATCSPQERLFSSHGLVGLVTGSGGHDNGLMLWKPSRDFEAQLQLRTKLQDLELSTDETMALIQHGFCDPPENESIKASGLLDHSHPNKEPQVHQSLSRSQVSV